MSAADFINGVLITGISIGCIYALVTLGFNALWKSTHVLNFAHGDLIMWAPMGALVAHDILHLPVGLSLLAGVLVPLIFGLICEYVAIRPYAARPGDHMWILSTLGVSIVLEQLATQPFRSVGVSFSMAVSGSAIRLGPIFTTPQHLLVIGAALAAAACIGLIYGSTTLGRMLLAVGEDIDGARALGISPARMSQIAMGLSAGVAALTGLTVAPLLLVTPSFGFSLVFAGFVAVALGGLGSIAGGVAGGILMGLLTQLTAASIGAQWTDVALFGALVLVYAVRPAGLFGAAPIRHV